jgi:hypothetical protein
MSAIRTTDLRNEDALESSIRDSALSSVARMRRAPGNESEMIAANLGDMVQRVSGASMSEIDRLMGDLQDLRAHLQSEAQRVQRTIAEFAHLSQSSVQSTTVIGEALDQLKRTADLPSRG